MNRELKDIIKLSGIVLDEEWANTPESTNHPDQEEMGDLRDWGTNVELSLRKYLNHDLASPEFPQPITEEEMSASYNAFINEVHGEIAEKAKEEEEAEEVEEAKEEDTDEDAEEVTEAQSPAQKAAFEKMLAAKNGNKEEATDDEEKVEEATEEDEEEIVEETVDPNTIPTSGDPYSGLYRMLTLAGIQKKKLIKEMVWFPALSEESWAKFKEAAPALTEKHDYTPAQKAKEYQEYMAGIKAKQQAEPWLPKQVDTGILNTEKSKRQSAQSLAWDKMRKAELDAEPRAPADPGTDTGDAENWWDTPGNMGFPPQTTTVCDPAYGVCKDPGGDWYVQGGQNDPKKPKEDYCDPAYGMCKNSETSDWYTQGGQNDPKGPQPWCDPAYGICGGGWTPDWQAEQDRKEQEHPKKPGFTTLDSYTN
jgi:hypothetical protein